MYQVRVSITVKKPNNVTADENGAAAVREKVARLIAERTKLIERWQANNAAWSDAVAAGRLFGVEVALPADLERPTPGGLPRYRVPLHQPTLFEPITDGSIREAVLEQLRKAGEVGAKAGDIRRVIEDKLGRKLHDKTIGMTLYRLSQRGFSRRDGWTWYATAKAAETETPAS